MMAAVIILGVLLALAIGAFGWAMVERIKLAQRVTAAEHQSASAGERAAAAEQALAELRGRFEQAERTADEQTIEAAKLTERLQSVERAHTQRLADLEAARQRERQDADEKHKGDFDAFQERMREAYKTLRESIDEKLGNSAAQALKESNERFLQLANEHFEKKALSIDALVKPIGETLSKTGEALGQIEKQRLEAYTKLVEQVEQMKLGNAALTGETNKLVTALRKPQVRGAYGEVQLKRVAELAGMTSYCDFSTQSSSTGEDGRRLRPDMVVSLPNERVIAVDAKTNIEPYLDAIQCDDPDEQGRHLDRFAKGVLDQAQALARKKYWSMYDGSPEFTVMFIPGDQFIDAALEREPRLLELAAEQSVLLASPSTLIGLLRAVAVGWREKQLSDSAQELFTLGRELHERTSIALSHAAKVGDALDKATRAYNSFVGSVDGRLMTSLRRFEEAGAKSSRTLEELKPIDASARTLQSLPQGGA